MIQIARPLLACSQVLIPGTMGCTSSKGEHMQGANFQLSEPVLEFESKVFEHGDVEVVQCSVQGWRKTMEDVALVQCGVSPREDMLALGVFDGHSGSEAAHFAKEKLLGHIKATDEWSRADISMACINGFLTADAAMRKSGVKSGTTAVLALVTPEEMLVANCGDSRSVLSRGGRQLPMSLDHKPGRRTERRRIVRSGGFLDEADPDHPRVVCDQLKMSIATSRSLGDFDFKADTSRQPEEQMISPVPEFYTRQRVPDDEFLILATDGVWDVMDNPGIVRFLQERALPPGSDGNNTNITSNSSLEEDDLNGLPAIDKLARAVLQRCLDLGSRDNMTIVLADLRPKPAPRKPPEINQSPPSASSSSSSSSSSPAKQHPVMMVNRKDTASVRGELGGEGPDIALSAGISRNGDNDGMAVVPPPRWEGGGEGAIPPAGEGERGGESGRSNGGESSMAEGALGVVQVENTGGGRLELRQQDGAEAVATGVSGRGSLGSAKHARVVAAVGSAKAGATVEEALWSNDEPVGRRRRLLSKSPETTQELEKGGVQKVLENDAIFISMNDVNN